MFCFDNLGCWGAWARQCAPSAEQWNNATATMGLKHGGQRVKPDAVRVQEAIPQAAGRDLGIRVLFLLQVEGRQSTIRHPTIQQQVKVLAHRATFRVRQSVVRLLGLAILHQARQMHPARHQVRRVRERQPRLHQAIRVVCFQLRVFQVHLRHLMLERRMPQDHQGLHFRRRKCHRSRRWAHHSQQACRPTQVHRACRVKRQM
jgi:hypothetical protein